MIVVCTSAAVAETCGDVNNDGAGPDLSDLTYLVNYLFVGGPGPQHLWTANVNGDAEGSVDLSDLIYLVNFLFLGGAGLSCVDSAGTVTDIDGNVYQTVLIGDQYWMTENLKVTRYRNGDPIPFVTDNVEWSNLGSGAYCEYDDDTANVAVYGRLYNWFAVDDSRNIAPVGWHVPTDDDWKQLETFLGMIQSQVDSTGWRGVDEGGKLKEAGIEHWRDPNTGATNEFGFIALPGGYCTINGRFFELTENAFFWTSSESDEVNSWSRCLYYFYSQIRRSANSKQYGFSVRCVRD